MGLVVLLVFLLVLLLAGVLGRVSDSRDYADWRPSEDGLRRSPR